MWVTLIIPLQCIVLLGNLRSWHLCGLHLTCTSHPRIVGDQVYPPHDNATWWQYRLRDRTESVRCRPRSQSDRQSVGRVGTSLIHGGPGLQKHTPLQPFQCQIPYGTPDRTSGHHALMGQSWFGFTRGTCTSRLVAHLMFERHLSSINQLNSSCHFNFQSDGKIKDSRSLYSHHTGVMSSVFMSLKSGFICLALDPDLKFRPGWPLNRTDLSKEMFFWVPGAM